MGGGEFTDGVADQMVRADAPGLQLPGECRVQGEQAGLGVQGLVQQRGPFGARLGEQHLAQRYVEVLVQCRAHLVQRVGEHRERGVQLCSHAGALAALAGVHEHQPAGFRLGLRPDDTGRRPAPGHRPQPVEKLRTATAEHRGTVRQGRAAGGERPGHVPRLHPGPGREVIGQSPGLGTQPVRSRPGDQPRHDISGPGLLEPFAVGCGAGRGRGGLFAVGCGAGRGHRGPFAVGFGARRSHGRPITDGFGAGRGFREQLASGAGVGRGPRGAFARPPTREAGARRRVRGSGPVRVPGHPAPPGPWCLLEDHVRVRAADPEGRHPRPPRSSGPGARPVLFFGEQGDGPGVPVDVP